MINVTSQVMVNGISYDDSGNEIHGTAYEEFIRWKPNVYSLGEMWYEMLGDAVVSLVLNTDNLSNFGLKDKARAIADASKRYARIYFASDDKTRALYIFNGVLKDIVRDYHYNDMRYNDLVNGLYRKIVALITL